MPHLEFLPERSTADVLTYHVSFQNDRWSRRVYGILNVPAKAGRYPALLRVPGAGVRPYQGDEWTARKGVIVLEIGIHAIPVTNPQKYYDDLFAGPLADYWHNATADRYRNYYRHVITGCIRSIDFIEQRQPADTHSGVGRQESRRHRLITRRIPHYRHDSPRQARNMLRPYPCRHVRL